MAEGGLPPCAGIEAENSHRVDCFFAIVLKVRLIVLAFLRNNRRIFCLLKPCNVVAQLVTSQPVIVDTTVTFFSHSDVLGPSRITRK